MAVDFKMPRIGPLGILGLLSAAVFFVAAVAGLFGGHSGNTNGLAPGGEALIHSGSKSTPLATDQETYDETQKILLAKDWAGLRQLVGQGRVFVVDEGTRLRVIEANWDRTMARVEILEGPQASKVGWIAEAYLAKGSTP